MRGLLMGNPCTRIYRYYHSLRHNRLPPSCTTFKTNQTFTKWYLKNFDRLPEINNYEVRLLNTMKESRSLTLTSESQCLMHYRYCYFPAARLSMPQISNRDVTLALNKLYSLSFLGITDFPSITSKMLSAILHVNTNSSNQMNKMFPTHEDELEFRAIQSKIEIDNWGSMILWKTALNLFVLQKNGMS